MSMAGYEAREFESKRQKLDEDQQIVDRISALPDKLIACILSCLPAKRAVRTCILSKRWRFAWFAVFNLRFFESTRKSQRGAHFEQFVNGVLSFHNALVLQRFELTCSDLHVPFTICSWISAAITRNVQELDIGIRNELAKQNRRKKYASIQNGFSEAGKVALPHCVYACRSLEALNINGYFILHVPNLVCLSSLKILCLIRIRFPDDSSLKKLLSSSPVLEELKFRSVSINVINAKALQIHSSSLKSLQVHNVSMLLNSADRGIVVDAPNLTKLDIYSDCEKLNLKYFTVRGAPSLVSASICLRHLTGAENVFFNLVENISNIESLSVWCMCIKSPKTYGYVKDLVFHNLKRIDMDSCFNGEFLFYLLEQSPNLASLTLGVRYASIVTPNLDSDTGCLYLNLEEVMIKEIENQGKHMDLIRYLLKKAPALKKMTLCVAPWRVKKVDIKQALTFPRASAACQIAFS